MLHALFINIRRGKLVLLVTAATLANTLMARSANSALLNGVWILDNSGNGSGSWTAAANWQGGGVASGGGIADFSQLDISADSTITLSAAENVGGLIFGDAGGVGTANNWTLSTHTLTLSGAVPAITVLNGTTTIGSVIAGTVGLIKTGPGTLLLNAAETFTGGLTISGGVVDFKDQSASLVTSNNLTFNGSGTFFLDNNSSAAHSQTLNSLTFNAGDGIIEIGNTTATQTGTNMLTFASLANRATGATGNFTLGLGTNTTFATDKIAFTTAPITNQFLSAGLFAGGSGYAVYDATGYIRPLNYGTDTNSISLTLTAAKTTLDVANGGTSAAGKDLFLKGGNITAQTTESINSLVIGAANNLTLAANQTLTIAAGGLLKTNSVTTASASTISGGSGITSGASELVIRTDTTRDTLTISNAVATSGGLTKSGAGTLTLSNVANTISGGTFIDGGTLDIAALGSLSLGSGNTLTFGGGTLQYKTGLASPFDVSPYINSIPLGTLAGIDTNGNNVSFGTPIGGAGGLNKAGAGSLTLNVQNGYTGGTTVSGGLLVFPSTSTLPASGQITVAGGGALSVSGAYGTIAGWLNSGQVATSSAGALALTASVNEDFTLSYSGGTYNGISIGAAPATNIIYTGTITPGSGGYFVGGGGGTITFPNPGAFMGGNNLTVGNGGGGMVIIGAANSFTGNINVSAGTLQIVNPAALGPGGTALTLGATATLDLNGNNLSVGSLSVTSGGVITDSSSTPGTTTITANIPAAGSTEGGGIKNGVNGRVLALVKTGPGTFVLNLASGNTFTGGITINQGEIDDRTNNANVLPASGEPLTFTGTGTFAASNNGTNSVTPILGSITIFAGDATIQSNDFANNTTSAQTLTIGNPVRSPGATLNFTLAGTGVTGGVTGGKYQVAFSPAPTADQSLDGGIYFASEYFASYDAGGFVRALQYGTDSNAVATTGGQANFGAGVNAGNDVQLTGGAITAQTSLSIRSLRIADSSNIALADASEVLSITGGGIIKDGGSSATISGGSITSGSNTLDLVVNTAKAGDVLTISSNISASGTAGLTKTGPGTLIVNGVNNFSSTSGVWINSGTLLANGNDPVNGALGAAPVSVNAGGHLAGTGIINGPVSVNAGGFLSAGDGSTTPGTLALAAPSGNTFADGSNYTWKISNATSGAGVGWDNLLAASLTIGSGAGVDVIPTQIGSGTLANFNASSSYQWQIASVPGNGSALVTNFHLDGNALIAFASNNGVSATQFSITSDPTDIFISYTAAPEPTSATLLSLSVGGMLLHRRRRTVGGQNESASSPP